MSVGPVRMGFLCVWTATRKGGGESVVASCNRSSDTVSERWLANPSADRWLVASVPLRFDVTRPSPLTTPLSRCAVAVSARCVVWGPPARPGGGRPDVLLGPAPPPPPKGTASASGRGARVGWLAGWLAGRLAGWLAVDPPAICHFVMTCRHMCISTPLPFLHVHPPCCLARTRRLQVDMSSATKARVLGACLARRDFEISNYLLSMEDQFGLPEVLRACTLLGIHQSVCYFGFVLFFFPPGNAR